jgi:predicted XRE-type DNA-binding protein
MKNARRIRGVVVQEGRGSVYADLGYPHSDGMVVKAQLVTKIADIIRRRGLTQQRVASLLGLSQPKVSRLLRGQFRGISERRLLRCLTRLGRDVEVVIKPARSRRVGRLSVLFARKAG